MGFGDAVKSVFGQYSGFSGRARRSEFWYFALFYTGSLIVAGILGSLIGAAVGSLLMLVVLLALIVPTVAVCTRRLHDTGRPGWWQLISIVAIFFYFEDSHGDNQYGPSPKAGAGQNAPAASR